jgi:hypothetical protein
LAAAAELNVTADASVGASGNTSAGAQHQGWFSSLEAIKNNLASKFSGNNIFFTKNLNN